MDNLKEQIIEIRDDVIKEITSLIKIKSVLGDKKQNMPFGEGPYNGIKHLECLANKLGFKTTNYDNYALEIEFGDQQEVVGVLCHVDVVPEGDNWKFDPYAGIIDNGKIYGRGALDDKGPLIINLFAMKLLMDNSIKLNKRIRMIVGANEESGSLCLDYYFNKIKRPQPTLAYTPDSNFPVTFAEKGIIRIELKSNFQTLKDCSIIGGNAYNSVADNAYIKYNNINVKTNGRAAHASKPELGVNAINKLFDELNKMNIENNELNQLITFFNEYIKNDIHGEHLNICFEDEDSGKLTTNIGFIKLIDNKLSIGLDIRVPVTIDNSQIIDIIKKTIPNWLEANVVYQEKSLYVSKDSFLVEKLMKVYKDITNDLQAKPIAIGGGTYARFCTNCVAFGALLKDQIDNMHQKDEYLEISKIDTLLEIYVTALYELAK